MSDLGTVFPPRDEWDVAAYDLDECALGYRESRPNEPEPGDNRSPAYRWGWRNRRVDGGLNDGLSHIRQAFIALSRRPQ